MNPLLYDTILKIVSQIKYQNNTFISESERNDINLFVVWLLQEKPKCDEITINSIYDILWISNVLYNNTSSDLLLLDDGVYDLLLEFYKSYNPNFQVGSFEIGMKETNDTNDNQQQKPLLFTRLPERIDDLLYVSDILDKRYPFPKPLMFDIIRDNKNQYIHKRTVSNIQKYPKLVGSLDKCKFVLCSEAKEHGVYNDSNVKILERDFFQKHIKEGILNPYKKIRILLELKYDGLSVAGTVSRYLKDAMSRGDANEEIATDLTPILQGYPFTRAPMVLADEEFGMKFEAIITKDDLIKFNNIKGKTYKNCRTGIIGLMSGSDSREFRDLITLVPITTSLEGIFKDRVEEIEFINKYYSNKVPLLYSVIEGNLTEVLFQINKFVKEAEYLRDYMNFMYDGVVVSYLDQDIIDALPRVNSINKHSMAVKFNPLSRLTTITGISYTVGQDGVITPMVHYNPVEFFGSIHTKSSLHSYKRFNELQLRYSSVIQGTYNGDVMTYITKPNNEKNRMIDSQCPPIKFTEECPVCRTKIKISDTGKNAYCPNLNCPGRTIARSANMLKKMNLKDFDTSQLQKLGVYKLSELANLDKDTVSKVFGEKTTDKFMDRMNYIKTNKMYDYEIIGSLGFDSIAKGKWRILLNKYSLPELLNMSRSEMELKISNVKGLGPKTAQTIIEQLPFFNEEIAFISSLDNIKTSKGTHIPKVRLTGFRDQELIEYVSTKLGFDIGEGTVTRDTDLLLVKEKGHDSNKVKQAINYHVPIMTRDEFITKFNITM